MRTTLALLLVLAPLPAADYYAAPAGLPTGNGSLSQPWDLQTALNKPLVGGDTLLLLDGTYKGRYTSTLNGGASQINLTAAPGAKPRIDGGLSLNGARVTVSYLEFFSSNTNRTLTQGDCLYTGGPNINLIHNVIHDCSGNGVGFWSSDANGIAYGNIIYYVGYNASDRGHGHGIYTQSNVGHTKTIEDNVVLNNFGWGLHAYTEGGYLENISYIGNTVSMNGSIASQGYTMNLLIGGYRVATSPVMRENVGYYPSSTTSSNAYLGYSGSGTTNATVVNNWFLGGTPLNVVGSNPGAAISGNWLMGAATTTTQKPKRGHGGGGGGGSTTPSCLSGNTCGTPPLTVLVRPDHYETGRALVTVLNVAGSVSQVAVDLSALGYVSGQTVYVASAENPLGLRRAFAVSGGKITLPLTGWTVAAPVGWKAPATTLPKFGAFVVRAQ